MAFAMTAAFHCAAQRIVGVTKMPKKVAEDKMVYDTAQVRVTYHYAYWNDTLKLDKRRECATVLLVGGRCTGFKDAAAMRLDSIMALPGVEKMGMNELFAMTMNGGKRWYDWPLVVDNNTCEATVQYSGLQKFQYTETLRPINWTLEDGDSTVCGVACKRASCHLGGRKWVAWYAPEYSLPFGPYLFRGLPGLIFAIKDTQGHHDFVLEGIEKLNSVHPIQLTKSSKIQKTSRKNVLRAVENMFGDTQAMLSAAGVTVSSGNEVPKSRPYNPIEKE